MKQLLFFASIFLLLQTQTQAQKETKHWYFGNKAAIAFPFNNNLPTALTNSNMANDNEGCASISNNVGSLLFYTNGEKIWDKTHATMPLPSPGILNGHSSAAQSAVIVPKPGSTSQYYVFSLFHSKLDKLRYSLVDMNLPGNGTLSNPLGNVVSTTFNVLAPGQLFDPTEMLTACKHANNVDYWVISHDMGNVAGLPRILVYLVTASGVTLNNTFTDGNMLGADHNGCIKVSPNRQKIAITYNQSNRVRLFNFNATTGAISLANTLVDNNFLLAAYGVEFSPNSNILYVSTLPSAIFHQINQFDLLQTTDANILASRYMVAIENLSPISTLFGFGQIQLGPDNRIYVSRGGKPALSYINLPNNLGSTCGFVMDGIPLLSGMSIIGLPNYIPTGDSVQTENTCDIFRLEPSDTNCCSAGITRTSMGNSNVIKVTFQVTGGVVQGYSSNCAGTPSSTSISGNANGTINFNPSCSLQLFNTSLQSTTSTGNMTVKYTVKFQNGDSCVYTTNVVGCPRSPLIQCDQVKLKNCICSGGNAGLNFIDIHIANTTIPVSPICGFIINKYSPTNVLQNTFFNNGLVMNATPPGVTLPGPVDVTGNPLANPNGVLNIQAYYLSSSTLNGRIEVITIHCNGDTCKRNWYPNGPRLEDLIYTDFNPKSVKSPFSKISAYSFRIAGPSASHSEPNPFKIKYLTINIPDSNGGPEIIGLSGAELFEVKERANMLKIEKSSHARYTALIEINQALNLKQNDSSGIFQLFFANGIPRNATFHFYDEDGSVLGSANSTLDTSVGVGVTHLGKNGFGLNQMMLFSGFPNPTSDVFNLSISMADASEIEVQITDINGKMVDKVNGGKLKRGLSEIHLNLGHLSNGTYFLQAKNQSNLEISNAIKVVVIR
jgi:hypothetical protein